MLFDFQMKSTCNMTKSNNMKLVVSTNNLEFNIQRYVRGKNRLDSPSRVYVLSPKGMA